MYTEKSVGDRKLNSSISNIEGIEFELPWKSFSQSSNRKIQDYCENLVKDETKSEEEDNSKLPMWICYFVALSFVSQACLSCEMKHLGRDEELKRPIFIVDTKTKSYAPDIFIYSTLAILVITIITIGITMYKFRRGPIRTHIYRAAQVNEIS